MTCKDCIHYEPCYEYGNILDPLGGGVKCDSFKNKADFVEVRHGEWIPIVNHFHGKPDGRYYCSVCHRVESIKGIYCRLCGAIMDGGNK